MFSTRLIRPEELPKSLEVLLEINRRIDAEIAAFLRGVDPAFGLMHDICGTEIETTEEVVEEEILIRGTKRSGKTSKAPKKEVVTRRAKALDYRLAKSYFAAKGIPIRDASDVAFTAEIPLPRVIQTEFLRAAKASEDVLIEGSSNQ